MRKWLRRIRGAVGIGVAWAVSWAVVQVTVLAGVVLVTFGSIPFLALASAAVSGAAVGFLSGLVFSAVFSAINREKAFEEIRTGQTALVGMAAGVMFPIVTIVIAGAVGLPLTAMALGINMLIGAAMGGVTSLGLVRVAKAAPGSLEGGRWPSVIDESDAAHLIEDSGGPQG